MIIKTRSTQRTSVNAGFNVESCTVSDGIQSGGEETIFIGPLTGAKILSTSDTMISYKQTYSRNVTTKRQENLCGQQSVVEGLGNVASSGQSDTEMKIGEY